MGGGQIKKTGTTDGEKPRTAFYSEVIELRNYKLDKAKIRALLENAGFTKKRITEVMKLCESDPRGELECIGRQFRQFNNAKVLDELTRKPIPSDVKKK